MANLIVSAVSTFDNKGLKKGAKEISAFDKGVKQLGKTFAGVFGAQQLLRFSTNAVKAFAADEKAAKALELQLKNTGFAFAAPAVEQYIADLQKTTAVLDDFLRPAFQQLLTVTGSVTQSQKALAVALDISAATGKSLTEVSAALTRGFSGNTAGLSRLGAGISKTTLKTGDMDKILGELQAKFAGQSAARLDTYAGKMDLLKVASANASETIGKGLLDSLSLLGKDNSIANLSTAMEGLATDIADVTYGLALLIDKFKQLPGIDKLVPKGGSALSLIPVLGPFLDAIRKFGAENKPGKALQNVNARENRLEAVQIKNAIVLRKAENDLLRKRTEIDKLKEKFDLERIGLNVALNAATDEETKLRIKAQIAILDNNQALAKKYNAELEAALSAGKLTIAFNNATDALSKYPEAFNKELIDAFGLFSGISVAALNNLPTPSKPPVTGAFTMPTVPTASYAAPPSNADLISAFGLFSGVTEQTLKITIDTANTGDRFAQLIAESIQTATKTGIATSTAGSL